MPTIDSIEINSVASQDTRNIHIDEIHQTTKSQSFVDMYPADRKGSCSGPVKQVKCNIDCGVMANIMPLNIFKMLNPSEFDKDGNFISGFNRDSTLRTDYQHIVTDHIFPLQQHGVQKLNFQD